MQSIKRTVLTGTLSALGLVASVALAPQAMAEEKTSIRLGFVQSWPSSSVTTRLAANIIEDELGYPVELVAVSAGPMYQGVASGDLDAMLSSWLPKTQSHYYEKVWPDVLNLGPNLRGTYMGLTVPAYLDDVNTIADLNDHAAAFDHKIYGQGAGAGINENARQAIAEYDLDFKLVKSSAAAMAASLKRANDRKEAVVITGWTPFWIWSKFDLKFLEDPEGIFGRAGYVATLASRELPDKAGPVYDFLRAFEIEVSTLNLIQLNARKSGDEEAAIDAWIDGHPDKIEGWISAAQASDA